MKKYGEVPSNFGKFMLIYLNCNFFFEKLTYKYGALLLANIIIF